MHPVKFCFCFDDVVPGESRDFPRHPGDDVSTSKTKVQYRAAIRFSFAAKSIRGVILCRKMAGGCGPLSAQNSGQGIPPIGRSCTCTCGFLSEQDSRTIHAPFIGGFSVSHVEEKRSRAFGRQGEGTTQRRSRFSGSFEGTAQSMESSARKGPVASEESVRRNAQPTYVTCTAIFLSPSRAAWPSLVPKTWDA